MIYYLLFIIYYSLAMLKPKIYPSVVTYKSDWKERLREVKKLKIEEISLFLTILTKKGRKEFYQYLEKSGVEYIPHVHIRHDFTAEEAQWLADNYGVRYFTIHLFLLKKFSNWKLAKKLCVEYNPTEFKGKNLDNLKLFDKIAGLCLDISHYHLAQRYHYDEGFKIVNELLQKYPIVINHLNGLTREAHSRPVLDDMHFIRDMKKNFWHLENTPKKLFSKNIYLELSNSIPKQFEIRDYLYQNFFR